jgi:uncharacterized membrane protein (UPF0127 family)
MARNTKFFIFFLILFLLLLTANHFFNVNKQEVSQNELSLSQAQATLRKRIITIGNNKLNVEVAQSVIELAVGLSYREKLGSDGMLFVLPKRDKAGFWMKDMNFDIDIVWIRDGKIFQITPKVEAISFKKNKAVYYPDEAIDWVLELESGKAATLNLQAGDLVVLE